MTTTTPTVSTPLPTALGPAAHDARGFPIFAGGSAGNAHVFAHRMSDLGRPGAGRLGLGQWLKTHDGSGSDWIHLQFHMAVFDIETDHWNAALERFIHHVEPAAVLGDEALTDAPELLWRLRLARKGNKPRLPWGAVHRRALSSLPGCRDPFVGAHHLLALAGAGDRINLLRWTRRHQRVSGTAGTATLAALGEALGHGLVHQYGAASQRLSNLLFDLGGLGGSLAQNKLWHLIATDLQGRAESTGRVTRH